MAAKTAGKGPNYGTIRLRHDNARLLTIKVTRLKPLDIGWGRLTIALYRPDRVLRDYHLLLALSNAFQGKASDDEDDMDCWLGQFSSQCQFRSMPRASKRLRKIDEE
ncbi:hypothetical protein Y032_0220g2521 [Ancylostoma ceylanicum]|uniref:Uncharacterized protein n=1 Tax=Ancylostoma ceylanicum TaxID=53326 RepID=A0A016SIH4_9BILA|nr:hypothetical protein Y032_0220g2521 [Ancylostoma ceylanicum]